VLDALRLVRVRVRVGVGARVRVRVGVRVRVRVRFRARVRVGVRVGVGVGVRVRVRVGVRVRVRVRVVGQAETLEATPPSAALGSRARGLNGGAADGMARPADRLPLERMRRSDATSAAAPAVGAARRGAAESSSVNEVIVPPARLVGASRLSSRRSIRCSSFAPGRCPTCLG